jgi:hypothetical protein
MQPWAIRWVGNKKSAAEASEWSSYNCPIDGEASPRAQDFDRLIQFLCTGQNPIVAN